MRGNAVVDTNVVSYMLKGHPHAKLYHRHIVGRTLVLCFVTIGELYFGAFRTKWGDRRIAEMKQRLRNFLVYPFDEALCVKWAEIRTRGEEQGRSISHADAWIAATALLHEIPLITHNRKHFAWIDGLAVISEAPRS